MHLHEVYCQALEIDRTTPNLALVEELVSKHLANYSFSNIEILLQPNKAHSLDPQDLLEKIVVRKRGGYCFEHNNLMFHVLTGLGYEVNTHLARVVYGENNDVPRTHQFNVVRIDGEDYLVDVGFGPYTTSIPVPFKSRENSPYKITDKGNLFELSSCKDGKDFVFYTFTLDECTPADFSLSHYYTSTHPDSKFVTTLVASRIAEDRTVFVNNSTFTTLENGDKVNTDIENDEELFDVLTKQTNLNCDREEASFLFQFAKFVEEKN